MPWSSWRDAFAPEPPSTQEREHPGREVTPDPEFPPPQYNSPTSEPGVPAWAQPDSDDPFQRTAQWSDGTPGRNDPSLTPRTYEERNS